MEEFFSENFFSNLELFWRLQNHGFGLHFFPQKINFIVFFKGDILKTFISKNCEKTCDFTLLNKPLEPYKLPTSNPTQLSQNNPNADVSV